MIIHLYIIFNIKILKSVNLFYYMSKNMKRVQIVFSLENKILNSKMFYYTLLLNVYFLSEFKMIDLSTLLSKKIKQSSSLRDSWIKRKLFLDFRLDQIWNILKRHLYNLIKSLISPNENRTQHFHFSVCKGTWVNWFFFLKKMKISGIKVAVMKHA